MLKIIATILLAAALNGCVFDDGLTLPIRKVGDQVDAAPPVEEVAGGPVATTASGTARSRVASPVRSRRSGAGTA